jgi:hypothetical protein
MLLCKLVRVITLSTCVALVACGGSPDTPEPSTGSASWEPGEWGFTAEIQPWPVEAGAPATLRASASADDYDQPFSGSVSYRLASSTSANWIRMRNVANDDGDATYEASVTLPAGEVGIHFLIVRTNDNTTHELTDWTVSTR